MNYDEHEMRRMFDNLTSVQARCTELLEEARVLRAIVRKALDGGRHGIGCGTLRLPSLVCDCWMAEARRAV